MELVKDLVLIGLLSPFILLGMLVVFMAAMLFIGLPICLILEYRDQQKREKNT